MSLQRRTHYGLPIWYEQLFDWNVTHRQADRVSVFRVTGAPSLPVALDLFGRRCKNYGRITKIVKVGPTMVAEQSTEMQVGQGLSLVSEALQVASSATRQFDNHNEALNRRLHK